MLSWEEVRNGEYVEKWENEHGDEICIQSSILGNSYRIKYVPAHHKFPRVVVDERFTDYEEAETYVEEVILGE